MSVRVRYRIGAYVSSTTAEDKDLANQSWEVVTDVLGEGGSWKTTLQPGDTDVDVHLGNLASAKILIVRTTSKDPTLNPTPLTFKKNNIAGEEIIVQPMGDAKEGHFLLSTDSITALYATNPIGGVIMDIIVVAAGD